MMLSEVIDGRVGEVAQCWGSARRVDDPAGRAFQSDHACNGVQLEVVIATDVHLVVTEVGHETQSAEAAGAPPTGRVIPHGGPLNPMRRARNRMFNFPFLVMEPG